MIVDNIVWDEYDLPGLVMTVTVCELENGS